MTDEELAELERTAVDLATIGGARIVSALGRTLSILYKSPEGVEPHFRDPVSEIDRDVETLIRAEVAVRFPGHDVVGEESEERPGRGHAVTWAVDPIDGTSNFVNGFPLFASSIGILRDGCPLVGAVWCSTSHALRPGVYHARIGGPLRFEFQDLTVRRNPAIRRRLAGLASPAGPNLPWDLRRTGSAAIECAFVAAGLLDVARFDRPNVWDIAGGLPLVAAAGGTVRAKGPDGWFDLKSFHEAEGGADVRTWQRPIIIGDPDAVEVLCRRSM
jgi:myo-inositol-1(or 4)-monophosphatase